MFVVTSHYSVYCVMRAMVMEGHHKNSYMPTEGGFGRAYVGKLPEHL